MDKMIKACVAIWILLVATSAAYYFAFALPAIQKEKLATQTAEKRLEQDQKCSARAKEFFNDSQFSEKDSGAWYENHFNSKLNKCLILIQSNTYPGGSMHHYKLLLDVNDGNALGSSEKRSVDLNPSHCEMLSKECKTEEEFDVFTKSYMER